MDHFVGAIFFVTTYKKLVFFQYLLGSQKFILNSANNLLQ